MKMPFSPRLIIYDFFIFIIMVIERLITLTNPKYILTFPDSFKIYCKFSLKILKLLKILYPYMQN